ncbi:MAG: nucleotide sugar dehydrogenase [Cyanobacteriota bacterium]|nr:nucleotide sugar dehydrogenase [Cyanobacteriota bacterium]
MTPASATLPLPPLATCTVGVIGLGYVGLPLAACFATTTTSERNGETLQRRVIGYDVNAARVGELRQGHDRTRELSAEELQQALAAGLELSTTPADLAAADVFIVTVPTPIDGAKRPELTPLRLASAAVGDAIKAREQRQPNTQAVVIYESTVYPGATEEECVPLLEQHSGLAFNEGFVVGYSPERLVPGDKQHGFRTITKVTSGSTDEAGSWVDGLYGSVVAAGTYLAPSLKVAEAAKVIENTQRDLNIALVNELAMIFARLDIDTGDVLAAAGTKWNFLPFRPGLVGGHCIGVDPYYLTHKAEQLGYYPQVVLSGRRINDGLADWLAERLIQAMARRGLVIAGAPVLVLGLTFKENCPDLRNTRVRQLVEALQGYGCRLTVVDPWVAPADPAADGVDVLSAIPGGARYAAVVAAVAHRQFKGWEADQWERLLQPAGVLLDLKNLIPRALGALRL